MGSYLWFEVTPPVEKSLTGSVLTVLLDGHLLMYELRQLES